MRPRAALALAACSRMTVWPVTEALQCFTSMCDDGAMPPCAAAAELVHSSFDCATSASVSQYGIGLTRRGNPYDACQKIRMTAPSYMGIGYPPEGEISYKCASTLEEEREDFYCGMCGPGGTGCSNDYIGPGFDVAVGGACGSASQTNPGAPQLSACSRRSQRLPRRCGAARGIIAT